MTDDQLADLERLAGAATPDWRACFDGRVWYVPGVATGCSEADARFAEAARTTIPALTAEVRRLRAELARRDEEERDRGADHKFERF